MHRWVVTGAHRFSLPHAQPAPDHLAGNLIHDAAVKQWLSQFLERWFTPAPKKLQETA
jgi:GMP synthase (glutamine-hydrolysing)